MYQKERQWEALPCLALANIFCRISITDRSVSVPFVCKSWASAAGHPQCWASMIAQNHSPPPDSAAERAFVKDSFPHSLSFADPFGGRRHSERGVASFEGLIRRAGGGAAVTSIYFFPFLTAPFGPPNDDAILRIIAQFCPNLKHLSFHGSNNASEEAIMEVIHSCKKLELVDFSDSPYFHYKILQELSNCCPNIIGIRKNGVLHESFSDQLSTGFPFLRILNISNSMLVDRDLLRIVSGCKKLWYLDVRGCQSLKIYMHLLKVALAKIPDILFD